MEGCHLTLEVCLVTPPVKRCVWPPRLVRGQRSEVLGNDASRGGFHSPAERRASNFFAGGLVLVGVFRFFLKLQLQLLGTFSFLSAVVVLFSYRTGLKCTGTEFWFLFCFLYFFARV